VPGKAIKAGSTQADAAATAHPDTLLVGGTIKVGAAALSAGDNVVKEVGTDNFVAGVTYEIMSLGDSDGDVTTNHKDAIAIKDATTADGTNNKLAVGDTFVIDVTDAVKLAKLNSLTENMTFRAVSTTDLLTKDIEAIQALVNTARVQAGSQYAAIESAVNYTTDLTAQYELGYNTVNDVNFSMETAHLAKNQILQQAATAMLAQANSGQQGLLQLIS